MDRQNKFQNSRICKQMCGECGKKYTRHLNSFRSNNTNSKFAQHLLGNGQALGKIDDIMEIKHFARKQHIWILHRHFFIYEVKKGQSIKW
jgi:hypothetical protein